DIERGKGWSLAGGLQHYWTPEIRSSIFGSFLSVSYGGPSTSYTTDGFVTGLADFKEWRVGGNVFWQPVSGLDLGVEVIYANVDPRGRIGLPGFTNSQGSSNAWEGRLRVQRDF
ncbi:porin, partial [Corallococcus exiguus]|uniref:hypothetical protein n=1 Tax=Corallococcus exiguus TaxID=83462 RepID=UPI0017D3A3E2